MKRFLRARIASWARRRQGADSLPVTVHYRRIYILPTRAGCGFGVLLFCMFIAGLNYSNSTALFLTFWLMGFVLVGLHRCHRNLLGIALQHATALPTFAGAAGQLELTLGNSAALTRLRIEADLPGMPASATDIAATSAARVSLAVPTTVRGRLLIDGLRLTTALPFGLFRAWTWVYLPLEIIVYPRARGSLPLPAVAGMNHGARIRGGAGGDEWLGLRAFRDGDSPRQVAWKAYARGAPLLVKEYCSASAPERFFDFERLPGLDTEKRLEQLSAWIVDADNRGERYALTLPGSKLPLDRGPQHRHLCLRALALFGLGPARHASAR
ncbi:MAG TPA: DUF58 domain-containing protein [Steroidobacteraceae bacterium]|nr:DUF58 domain-containing protein [Steroidobacteraceae bacterium]